MTMWTPEIEALMDRIFNDIIPTEDESIVKDDTSNPYP